jgi:roadblock/LC7 domain-containing protein
MARRQKQDSVQEKAVTTNYNAVNADAIKAVKGQHKQLETHKLEVGMHLVTHVDRAGKADRVTKIDELDWSRRREWVKVNGQYVYSIGGFADVLFTEEDATFESIRTQFPAWA